MAVERAFQRERQATTQLIALLGEVDSRKLYAKQGCSSLFTYCVQMLHFSEHAAYLRIEAARLTRRFPMILDRLSDGSLHLTAVSLLGPHLTEANHLGVLDAARHKTKREIEHLLARLRPQPDVPAIVRKLPSPARPPVLDSKLPVTDASMPLDEERAAHTPAAIAPIPAAEPMRAAEVKPLAPGRYKIQFTVSRETYDKLRRVQDLMRHRNPSGDPAAIFDHALTLLLDHLSKRKFAATNSPRSSGATKPRSRHIPAAIKREVWTRDDGRCAFEGEQGRCTETGFLEFHHVVPYAEGGATTRANLELRCRAHNMYDAEQYVAQMAQSLLARERCAVYG